MKPLYAIMLDGEFCRRKLFGELNRNVGANGVRQVIRAEHIMAHIEGIKTLPCVAEYELLRAYFYDCEPMDGAVDKPVTGESWDLTGTVRYRNAASTLDRLRQAEDVAVRLGHLVGKRFPWRLKESAIRRLIEQNGREHNLQDADFSMDIQQKGVDMRIGLDIARLALREMVRCVVVITGDSDFVPAFKFARREGVRVVLVTMGHNVRPELTEHADLVVREPVLGPNEMAAPAG